MALDSRENSDVWHPCSDRTRGRELSVAEICHQSVSADSNLARVIWRHLVTP